MPAKKKDRAIVLAEEIAEINESIYKERAKVADAEAIISGLTNKRSPLEIELAEIGKRTPLELKKDYQAAALAKRQAKADIVSQIGLTLAGMNPAQKRAAQRAAQRGKIVAEPVKVEEPAVVED